MKILLIWKYEKENNLDYRNRYKLEFSHSCNVQVLLLKKFVQYGVANQICYFKYVFTIVIVIYIALS